MQRNISTEFLDPRGPLVRIVTVENPTYEKPIVTLTLSCGHESLPNPIYTYKVGADYRCFKCRQAQSPLFNQG